MTSYNTVHMLYCVISISGHDHGSVGYELMI